MLHISISGVVGHLKILVHSTIRSFAGIIVSLTGAGSGDPNWYPSSVPVTYSLIEVYQSS